MLNIILVGVFTLAIIIRHSTAVQALQSKLNDNCNTVKSCVLLTSSISLPTNVNIACSSDRLLGTFLGPVPATELVNGKD